MPVVTQIQIRRGVAASWTSANPTLAAGEIGYETDTGKAKIGNGSTAWTSLAYAITGATGDVTLTGTQTLTNKTLTSPVLGGTTSTASGNLVIDPATSILEVQGDGSSVDASIQLNCYVNSHGQKIKSQPHAQAASNTLLLPGGNTIGNNNAVLVSDTGTQTLTNKTISGASNTLSSIANGSLTNSSITINGSPVSLGGSVTIEASSFVPSFMLGGM